MSDLNTTSPTPPRSRRGWVHFGIAAGFLLIVTIGWSVTMNYLGYVLRKEPVEWPVIVQVDAETFQNTSLPARLTRSRPFRVVSEDGSALTRGEKDGEPDGKITYREDLLETLAVGSPLDKQRYPRRRSNWYFAWVLDDTRVRWNDANPADDVLKYWMLSVTFYTGSELTVPHVVEVCGPAGGATLVSREVLTVSTPDVPAPWGQKPKLVATRLEKKGVEDMQFYLFVVNGSYEDRSEYVRMDLLNLMRRYVYYAKIQFSPRLPIGNADPRDVTKAAEGLLKHVLPEILREFPTKQEIAAMREKSK